jgi:hypothetical protein
MEYETPYVIQSAVAATGNGVAFPISGYSTLSLAVTGTFVGTVTFEGQDAAGNWTAINGKVLGGFSLATSTTTTGTWEFNVAALQAFRARVSAYTSGSITATIIATSGSNKAGIQNVVRADRMDPTNDAVTVYPFGHSYTYISTATTTTVKSGSGVLAGITIEGGTTGTIIIYDNTAGSGTIIASFDTTNALNNYFLEPIAFSTGLTIVTSAATKLTVAWR